MAQGQFTKQEADETTKAVTEIMEALPKRLQMEFFGHFNDIFLFLHAARKHAPDESEKPES